MNLPYSLILAIESILQTRITGASALAGGCIHHATCLETSKGPVFLKYNDLEEATTFEVEAKGLDLLHATETLHVPQVFGTGSAAEHSFLLLEFIQPGTKSNGFWGQLGRGLASLHSHSNLAFGLDHHNVIGRLPQSNHEHGRWADFFREERLAPMVQMALDKGELTPAIASEIEAIYPHLQDYFPQESPALIHGDLWGGNLLTGPHGEPVLIDPAVYYGHREAELAFMSLFDTQPPAFYAAYEEEFPLTPGYRNRFDLYNLYPLLVHLNLFGQGYLAAIRQIVKRYS